MSEEIVCDHTSVGVIARDDQGRILLIERRKTPFGWAPPSGHCDGDIYPIACCKEFYEETGLRVVGAPRPILPKNPRKEFKCRRGGEYHHWQIFEVKWEGELSPNTIETNGAFWGTVEEIKLLAKKTETYLSRIKESEKAEEESWAVSIKESIEKEWQANPGLELVWYEFFQELNIIPGGSA